METVIQEILHHAQQVAPQECCGLVVSQGGELRYLPCENIAFDPLCYFEIAPDEFIVAEALGDVVAVVHSHPDHNDKQGLPYLSTADRACQRALNLPFWLVCRGKLQIFRPIAPLIGRRFENNQQDCRNIILDSYMLAGRDIPDRSRYEFNWFEQANLYEEGLIAWGFERLAFDAAPQLGDVILLQIGSPVANHAGIYLGNQMMLHHSQGRLSARVPYDGSWLSHTHSIWRDKQWQQLSFTAILNDLALTSR